VFAEATGETLYPGTLNVKVSESLPIREDFRIEDPLNPEQYLLFEICRISGRWAYRIRPYHRETGEAPRR
jgi:CTP-dependent riboflavin kinase